MEKNRGKVKNFLFISGSERNCGKTQLVERLIGKMRSEKTVTAVKITSHIHPQPKNYLPIQQTSHYKIYKETKTGKKDSERFVAAGASEVFYIECPTEKLYQLSVFFNNLKDLGNPVIVETGGLAKYIRPAVMVFVTSKGQISRDNKKINLENADIIYDGTGKDIADIIRFDSGIWKIIK